MTTPNETRNRLIKAGVELFAERGFRGTSMRDLAVHASLSEVTLFRLFGSKEEIYIRVLDSALGSSLPDWLVDALETEPDDVAVFSRVADDLQAFFTPQFVRLVLFAALEQPGLLEKFLRPRLSSFYSVLSDHITQRIEAGAMRTLNPSLAARALVGLVFYHQIFTELLGGKKLPGHAVSEPMRVYAGIWMHGVLRGESKALRASAGNEEQACSSRGVLRGVRQDAD